MAGDRSAAVADLGVEAIGQVILHPGHPTEAAQAGSAASFDWTLAAALLLVGSVGALLYWYYGRRVDAS